MAILSAHLADRSGVTDAYTIQNQAMLLRAERAATGALNQLVPVVSGIALMLGAIGILTVMLMSVRERTREIGLRRALGASRRNIRTQFVLESGMLGIAGGAVGRARRRGRVRHRVLFRRLAARHRLGCRRHRCGMLLRSRSRHRDCSRRARGPPGADRRAAHRLAANSHRNAIGHRYVRRLSEQGAPTMKHKIVAMIASAAFASATAPAMADNLAFNVIQNFTIWATPGVQALKLNDAGLMVRTFNNPVQGLVSVTYTAECSLEAPPTSWLSISIYIDNVLVPPSSQIWLFAAGGAEAPDDGRQTP